jgi:hypothetical protein
MAEIMAQKSDAILDENTRKEVLQHLSESDLVEVGLYFAFVSGLQKFNNVFEIYYGVEE